MRSGTRALLVVLVAALVAAVVVPWSPAVHSTPEDSRTVETVTFVRPAPNGSARLWPYTSRGESFSRATLPINVVVYADVTTVKRLLAARRRPGTSLYWNETAGEWTAGDVEGDAVTINGTHIYWGESTGAARYTYVLASGERGWRDARYQLHDGTYFGARYHLRLYEGGSGNDTWTAIQAHYEYWDWFRLRHDVVSLSKAQHYVERDFQRSGVVSGIGREYYGNGGPIDADGWVTVVGLESGVVNGPRPLVPVRVPASGATAPLATVGLALALAGWPIPSEWRAVFEAGRAGRLTYDHVLLGLSVASLPLVVRTGAIWLEHALPGASPVLVGGPFYALLVLGGPACATLFGRSIPAEDGFAVAVLGFGAGIMADYAYLDVAAIPYGALIQRLVLLFGLGLVAAGGTRWATDALSRHRYRTVGLVLWVGGLLWPLAGVG